MVVGKKPGLAAIGSATVAVLSESSGIEQSFSLPCGGGHVLTRIAPFTVHVQTTVAWFYYILLYVIHARSVFWEHHLVAEDAHTG